MLESALLHRRVTDLLRTAKFLLLLMIIYNVIEGVIAVSSGFIAGSIAPVAFGADSYINLFAATLVLWRIGVALDGGPLDKSGVCRSPARRGDCVWSKDFQPHAAAQLRPASSDEWDSD